MYWCLCFLIDLHDVLQTLETAAMCCDQQVFLGAVLLQMTLQSNPLFPLDFIFETALPFTAKGTEPLGFQVLAIKLKCHGVFLLLDEPKFSD